MLLNIALLLLLLLAGEIISFVFSLPIPGPVIGMVFLLLLLIGKNEFTKNIRPTASVLLAHLGLLFVPAGVGVIQYLDVLKTEGLAIGLVIVVGTAITMVITALTIKCTAKLLKVDDED